MTQMLLFDPLTQSLDSSGSDASTTPCVVAPAAASVASQLECESGLHHMGELARLVLLRYDLMARRRAEMAKRRSQPCDASFQG